MHSIRRSLAIFASQGLRTAAAVSVTALASAATLVEDDFEDGVLDPALWTVRTNIPQGGASVTETGGQVLLVARGYLVTVDQFDPEVLGPLRVSGEWTFINTGDIDFIQILVRSDGQPDPGNCCGETTSGVEFRIQTNQNALTIATRGGFAVADQANNGLIVLAQGTTYRFEVIDYGDGNLSMRLEEKDNPSNFTSATATLTTDPTDTNHVVFHNRESSNRTAALDNVVIEVLEDSDGDGMLDDWEIEHGLDPEDDGSIDFENGADGDPDMDGVRNVEEFERGTHPRESDTDGDGSPDGDELDFGTDPLNPDSDGDGLADGVETKTGSYVGPTDTGTDPLDADSDGDGVRDGFEVTYGSDPTDPGSIPPAIPLPIADDFEDGVFDDVIWRTDLNIPQGGAAVREQNGRAELVARGHLITNRQFDPADGGLRLTGQWTFVSGDDFMQVLTRTDGLPAGQYGETANGIEFLLSLANDTKILEIRTRNAATIELAQDPAGMITAGAGMTFDFEIIDDGMDGLSFTMTEVGNPGNTATTTATVIADNFDLNYVAFHNRESARVSYLEEIRIERLFEEEPLRITEIAHDPGAGTLRISWESANGQLYNLRSETDPSTDPGTWPIFETEENIEATPPVNTRTFPLPADAARYFVVEAIPAPPVAIFSDDFENGQGEWTTGSDDLPGTQWELGAPSLPGPAAANSPENCFGTNLAAEYTQEANVWLRSPAIDLSAAANATLHYFRWIDIESGFDFGQVAVLDANDLSELAVLETTIEGLSTDWESVSRQLPAAALGRSVVIEFRLDTDTVDLSPYAGFYIDDVMVTVP